jgi:hypothetical protein
VGLQTGTAAKAGAAGKGVQVACGVPDICLHGDQGVTSAPADDGSQVQADALAEARQLLLQEQRGRLGTRYKVWVCWFAGFHIELMLSAGVGPRQGPFL